MIKGKVKLNIENKTTVKASQAVKMGKHKVATEETKVVNRQVWLWTDGRITAAALGPH